MRTRSFIATALSCMVALMLSNGVAMAQQFTGVPGAPDATTTIDGKQLPAPTRSSAARSRRTPSNPSPGGRRASCRPRAPERAAHHHRRRRVRCASTSAAYSDAGLDRIAKNGLRYNNIHSTALCSPTRAALITGRNHHSAGFGVIAEQATGYPGYNSFIAKDKATIGKILKITVTPPRGSARTTTRPPSRPVQSGRSTNGRPAWASSISTASLAETPTSGSRTCSATRRRSIRSRASRNGTSPPPWPTTPLII